nr:hypothetical protein 3 [Ginkgo biloba tombusvirus]
MTKRKQNIKSKNMTGPKAHRGTTSVTRVSAPVNMGSIVTRTAAPKVSSTADGLRVVNSERVAAVTVGTVSARQYLAFNPCSASQFGWLRNVAKCYSKYRVNRLRYLFVPSVPTTVGGVITATWFGDPDDAFSWATSGGTDSELSAGFHSKTVPIFQPATLVELSGKQVHQAQPWFDCAGDASVVSGETVAGSMALYWYASSLTTASPGLLYCEYDITFVQPVSPLTNLTRLRLGGSGFPSEWPVDPPTPTNLDSDNLEDSTGDRVAGKQQ